MLYENCGSSPQESSCVARERMGRAQKSICKQDQYVLLLVHKLKTLSKFVNRCIMSLGQMNIKNI
ncbi:hypothetical protein Hanom_Chr14g01260121 [Helianthus anomalus]